MDGGSRLRLIRPTALRAAGAHDQADGGAGDHALQVGASGRREIVTASEKLVRCDSLSKTGQRKGARYVSIIGGRGASSRRSSQKRPRRYQPRAGAACFEPFGVLRRPKSAGNFRGQSDPQRRRRIYSAWRRCAFHSARTRLRPIWKLEAALNFRQPVGADGGLRLRLIRLRADVALVSRAAQFAASVESRRGHQARGLAAGK